MENSNRKIKKISDLPTGAVYKVLYYTYGNKINARTKTHYLSCIMILQGTDGVKFWTYTPNEKSAFKLVGCLNATISGCKATFDTVTITETNGYKDFKPTLIPFTKA